MYPKSAGALSNEYVEKGYEASFGSYDINETTHTVTHHVQGSNTGDLLVGKDLPRVYQFSTNGHLVIKSARSDEHWSVTWEHHGPQVAIKNLKKKIDHDLEPTSLSADA